MPTGRLLQLALEFDATLRAAYAMRNPDGQDAAEMLMAGASVVGVGTAVYYRGVPAMQKIGQELVEFIETHNFPSIDSLRGRCHR